MTTTRHATVRGKSQLTLPSEVREALHVEEGDEVEFVITDSGEVMLSGLTRIPASQKWFWAQEWQAGEQEASTEIESGQETVHEDVDAMFAELDR